MQVAAETRITTSLVFGVGILIFSLTVFIRRVSGSDIQSGHPSMMTSQSLIAQAFSGDRVCISAGFAPGDSRWHSIVDITLQLIVDITGLQWLKQVNLGLKARLKIGSNRPVPNGFTAPVVISRVGGGETKSGSLFDGRILGFYAVHSSELLMRNSLNPCKILGEAGWRATLSWGNKFPNEISAT